MKEPCEVCRKRRAIKSSIVEDYYYKYLCLQCYEKLMVTEKVSSGEANYNRGRDYEEHVADHRQPYTDGKPDFEFIKLYPSTASKMFTEEEINQAERS